MHEYRYGRHLCLFGNILSIKHEKDNECSISVQNVSKGLNRPQFAGFPQTFSFKLPIDYNVALDFSDSYRNPSIAGLGGGSKGAEPNRLASFVIALRYGRNETILGFDFVDIVSVDLDLDVDECLTKVATTRRAVSTNLPIGPYLDAKGVSVQDGRFEYRGLRYEMAQVSHSPTGRLKPDELLRPEVHVDGLYACNTIVSLVQGDHTERLNLGNISLIFDKFYRPVRGLGYNFEHTYGESVSYYISSDGCIVHRFQEDKVSESAFKSSRVTSTETIVIRIGDRLSSEMLEFLREPVKGHYSPTRLYQD